MHGMESGPGGSKDRYLRQHFEKVCTPNMQMSLFSLTKSNSILRNILRRPLFLGWLMLAAGTLPLAIATYEPLALLGCLVLMGSTMVVILRPIIRQALNASIDRSVEIQAKAIEEFQPDIIVGASWGAFVALICASRRIYIGPQLLLAPPLKLVLDKLGDLNGSRWQDFCKSISAEVAQRILVIHGDQDTTVPVLHSQLLSASTGIELRVISGDHRLNSALLGQPEEHSTNDRLKKLIHEVVAKHLSP